MGGIYQAKVTEKDDLLQGVIDLDALEKQQPRALNLSGSTFGVAQISSLTEILSKCGSETTLIMNRASIGCTCTLTGR
jgi:hypothetical protein